MASRSTTQESSPPRAADAKATATLDLSERGRRSQRMRQVSTAWRSFRVLRGLTPQKVDSFMDSYIIYDLDWQDEKTMRETLGPDYQKRVGQCLADYYSVLNHLCAIGELEKMYIPPAMDLTASLTMNQILYEESIAKELCLPPNPKLLDLGCGRGRVAAHMTRMSGAQVTGLNIDADQIASAISFNTHKKYSNAFIRADFNDLPLPLPSAHFDGFYQIQAFSLCKDIPALCRELFRVLKPGARVSLLDWASLEAYNPEDEHHLRLMRAIKPLIGAVGTPTPASMAKALEGAGFMMLQSNNASLDGLQAPLIERADKYFRTTRVAILGLVKMGVLPPHFKTLFNRLTQDCDAFVEADRKRLITTTWHWLAVKPETTGGKMISPADSELSVKEKEGDSPLSSELALQDAAATAAAVSPEPRTTLPVMQSLEQEGANIRFLGTQTSTDDKAHSTASSDTAVERPS